MYFWWLDGRKGKQIKREDNVKINVQLREICCQRLYFTTAVYICLLLKTFNLFIATGTASLLTQVSVSSSISVISDESIPKAEVTRYKRNIPTASEQLPASPANQLPQGSSQFPAIMRNSRTYSSCIYYAFLYGFRISSINKY